MIEKPKVKPSETHVPDDDNIEQPDDSTLTSVRNAPNLPEPEPLEEDEEPKIDDLDFEILSPDNEHLD